jgi:autotransporter-associated beta strand protein
MKSKVHSLPNLQRLLSVAVAAPFLALAGLTASAVPITFSTPANCSGDTDVKFSGGNQLFAYTWGGATNINGLSFTATAVSSGAVGPNLVLSAFTGANATAFTSNAAPFNALSGAYSNILRGSVFNATVGTTATATMSNLVVGHTYFLEIWAGDPRFASSNRVEFVSSGGGTPVLLVYNSTTNGGGVGQYTYATFTADSTAQDITFDGATPAAPASGDPQINAIQLRDITGVWSGTTSGNWSDSDNSSQNFSGANYAAVKAVTANVYFGDKDGNGAAVATSTITVGAGGASGTTANFNNNSVNYTLTSADATGIAGANGVTVSGTGTVNLNGANSYTGNTVLNSGTLALGNAGALGSSAAIVLGGGTLDVSALGSVTLNSGQSLRGSGTVNGSVTAASGSTLVPGGIGTAGTLTVTNNLTLNGQTMTFDLSFSPGGGDKIAVGNVLTVNTTCTLSLHYIYGTLAGGTYTLMTFASMTGAGTFVLDTTYPGVTLNVNSTSVTLTVSGGGGTSGTFTNLLGGVWGAATNWQGGIIATNVDGVADFSTLTLTSGRTVTVEGIKTIGHLVFGTTGANNFNWNEIGATNFLTVSSGSPKIIIVGSNQNTTISTSLQGNQGFTKLGGGTLTMTGANRLTNGVNVLGGTLALSVNNPFGPTTGATQVPLTLSNAVLMVNGAYLLTNTVTLPAGTSNYLSGTSGFVTGAGLYGYGSGANPISGAGTLVMNIVGANNPRLNGGDNQNFTGQLIVNTTGAGGLLTAFDDLTTLPRFGFAGSSNASYTLNGTSSALYYMGTSDWVAGGRTGCTNYMGALNGGAALYANNGRSGSTTLEIGGLNVDCAFSGAIKDNHLGASPYTPMIVRKVGTGTLTLSGASTYTGATDVRKGRLLMSGSLGVTPVTVQSGAIFEVNGSLGSPTISVPSGASLVLDVSANLGSGALTVDGLMDTTATGGYNLGSLTLNGAGVITGSVTLATGSINPGSVGGAGTLTISNGNFTATGGTLNFDLSSTPASGNDFLSVNGNMDFSTPGVTISINKISGSLGGGTYVLAQCSGTLSGSVGNLTLVGANPLDVLQISGNQLQLIVSPVTTLTWRGDGSGNLWDIGTSTTWVNGATPSTYADGNAVIFDNTGGTNPVVNIPANVLPAIVTVNSATNYTFRGAGAIGDGGSLVKNGTGTLTIANTNVFVGEVFVNSGTLSVGNAGTNGSLAANITNNAALVFNTPSDQVSSNAIRGPGLFTKLGAGQLTMIANSTMSGATLVSAGTLTLGDGSTTAGSLGTGNVTNNAALAFNRPDSLSVSNAIRNQGVMENKSAGLVRLAGVISGTGTLTNDSGAGALELVASNSFSGGTWINGGSVMLRNLYGFGAGNVVVDDAGGGVINIAPLGGGTNVIPNNIKLPAATTPQFVVTDLSLTSMGTVQLPGVISGGMAGNDTRLVNGGGTPAGNPRLTIVLENPANSFTMTPDVYSGCLAFTSDAALGNPTNGLIVQATANFPGSGFTDAINLVGLRFDANNITLNANRAINLVGTENINVQNNNGTIAGPVSGLGMTKLGTGTLTLNGAGSLTGTTTVNAGTLLVNSTWAGSLVVNNGATLGGGGTILGPVSILTGGTLSPGNSIGTLAISNNLSFVSTATNIMEINAGSVTCDKVIGVGTLTYGGTLMVTNTGGTLASGQTYPLFSANLYAGSFNVTNLPALPSSLRWQWTPTNGTLAVVPAVNTTPTNITAVVSGGNLNLSWPADHLGWSLQSQTNSDSVGLSNNWFTVPGSSSTTSMSIPIDSSKGAVFFRMVYP